MSKQKMRTKWSLRPWPVGGGGGHHVVPENVTLLVSFMAFCLQKLFGMLFSVTIMVVVYGNTQWF